MRLATLALVIGLAATPGVVLAQDSGSTTPTQGTQGALHGVDVSYYQGNIDWERVASSGIKFAFIRAADGFHHDTKFTRNWSGAKSAGILRGAYHYFRGSKDGTQQANDFLNVVGDDLGDLAPVADVEELDGVSAATLKAQLEKWISTVQGRTCKTPIIYTSPGLWNGWHMGTTFSSSPLWVANWAVSKPRVPSGWSDWTVWQYRSDASVPGIPGRVDADLFHGSLDELKAFGKSGAAPTSHPSISVTPGLVGAVNGVTGAANGNGNAGSANAGAGGDETVDDSDSDKSSHPLLRESAAGTNVRRLQEILNKNGANLEVDGVFGDKTKAAVEEFQRSHGCRVDGVVGPETWGALDSATATPAAPATQGPAPTVAGSASTTPTATPIPSTAGPLNRPIRLIPLKAFPPFGDDD